jgi:hypothetical protein
LAEPIWDGIRDCSKFEQGGRKFDQTAAASRNYLIGAIDRSWRKLVMAKMKQL